MPLCKIAVLCLMVCLHPSSHLIFFGDLSCNWIVSLRILLSLFLCVPNLHWFLVDLLYFLIYYIVMFCTVLYLVGFVVLIYFIFGIVGLFLCVLLIIFVWLLRSEGNGWSPYILGPLMDLIFWLTSFLLAFTNKWSIWFRVVSSGDIRLLHIFVMLELITHYYHIICKSKFT